MDFYSSKVHIILCLNISYMILQSNYSRTKHKLKIMQEIKYLTEYGFRKEISFFLKILFYL